MADGMREKTTNVGGVIKRIWYAMTGATQGAELASLDDTGILKAKQFAVQTMNTAPASTSATGTTGDIRVTSTGIFFCVATNFWRKAMECVTFTETITGLTSTFKNSTLMGVSSLAKYQWLITSGGNNALIESSHNLIQGTGLLSLVTGATVEVVTANSVYSVRIGDSVLEIKFNTNGNVSYRITSGTVTQITVDRLQQGPSWL